MTTRAVHKTEVYAGIVSFFVLKMKFPGAFNKWINASCSFWPQRPATLFLDLMVVSLGISLVIAVSTIAAFAQDANCTVSEYDWVGEVIRCGSTGGIDPSRPLTR